MSSPLPLLFDTDIGTNVDDALALAYLLRHPRCDLLGVTTVSGDVAHRSACAEVVCRAAGRPDVPIHAGSPGPLLFGPGQPDVPLYDSIRPLPHRLDRPAGSAVEFLRQTIRARPGQVTLLTTGALTNIALLFATDPEIPQLLRGAVSMAGLFFPPPPPGRGEVETNCRCDPLAAAMAFAGFARVPRREDGSPGHLSVGLDVSCQCAMPADEARRRFTAPPMDVVMAMAEAWLGRRGGGPPAAALPVLPFHDPLAAAAVFEPGLCAEVAGQVRVDVTPGSAAAGKTSFFSTAQSEAAHRAATGVDPRQFFGLYFDVLPSPLGSIHQGRIPRGP